MAVLVYLNTYNPVVTLRNLRLAFLRLYFMQKKCNHELFIFVITELLLPCTAINEWIS